MWIKTTGIKRNKAYGKKLWKKAGTAIKKRYIRNGGLRQLSKDVAIVKSMINAEKKYTFTNIATTVGQCSVNADSGYYATDITPIPSEGITQTSRNGASIKVSSMILRCQLVQQTNLNTDMRVTIYIIKNFQNNTINAALVNQFLVPDAISTMTDYNSIRNPDYFKLFRVIAKKSYKLSNDSATSQNQLKDFQINLSFKNHHVRFNADTNTVASGQIWMLVVADTGNKDGTTASTLTNVGNTAVNTGARFICSIRNYYYDN